MTSMPLNKLSTHLYSSLNRQIISFPDEFSIKFFIQIEFFRSRISAADFDVIRWVADAGDINL